MQGTSTRFRSVQFSICRYGEMIYSNLQSFVRRCHVGAHPMRANTAGNHLKHLSLILPRKREIIFRGTNNQFNNY